MSTELPQPMILAIGSQDNFLHVYHDAQEVLQDDKIGAGKDEKSGPLEFFDSDGYRLTGQYSPTWQLRGLTRTEEPPDQSLVRQRVQNCIDHLRSYIKSHPEQVETYRTTVDEVLAQCPDLGGSTNFATSLKQLADAGHHRRRSGELTIAHITDDPIHNFFHGSGWQN